MQQRRIDQAENRRGRADPQRHRQNRDSRKPRRLGQHADREARVLQQVFKKRQPLLCVVILSHCPRPSELHHRLPPCLFRIHPRAQILLRLQGDMLLHLLPQPFVVSPPGRKVLEPRQKPSQKSHGKSSAFTSKNRADDRRRLLPVLRLHLQLLAPFFRQAVETRPAIIFRRAPVRCDRPFLLQLQQHRIKRPLVHRQQISADLLDAPRNPIPVLRLPAHQES